MAPSILTLVVYTVASLPILATLSTSAPLQWNTSADGTSANASLADNELAPRGRSLLDVALVEVRRLPTVRVDWTRSKDSVGWSSNSDPMHSAEAKCINPPPFGKQVKDMSCQRSEGAVFSINSFHWSYHFTGGLWFGARIRFAAVHGPSHRRSLQLLSPGMQSGRLS